ncbi:MAG: DUF1553 domain-containing protein [Fimbriimonadales bacterium]
MLGRLVVLASCLGVLAIGIAGSATGRAGESAARSAHSKVEFNRDIRPIVEKCLTCHGHDPKQVMAGLRLDDRDSATSKLRDGKTAIVPGHPEQSELIHRINSTDPDEKMPPPSSNKTLTEEEKGLLKLWIEEGAEYKKHWAFVAPVRPSLPAVKLKTWPRNPIDAFILAKLEENGLKPSPEADRRTLIRRVSLDLTGIPPTPREVDAFLKDKSPNAYEKVVDRLLASPRYGERMAMDWLDYARYADSNGYQADWERFQWRWRDWVIDAYNNGMPFDQFTIKQIAGDLLPSATMDDKLATGFNRNHRINTEGGVIAEEWRVENVIDRVETTSYTWMGLTAGCARCHDHKYDPITQKEFYSLFAYFNNVPESGTGVEAPVDHPPIMKAPYPAQAKQMQAYDEQLVTLRTKLAALTLKNATEAANWKLDPKDLPVLDGKIAEYKLGRVPTLLSGDVPAPKAVGEVGEDPGRFSGAVTVSDKGYVDLGTVGDFDTNQPFSYSLWVNPDEGSGSPLSRMDAPNAYRGWDMFLQGGRPAFHLINAWPEKALKVVSRVKIPNKQWSFVTVTYDGSAKSSGAHIYVNGVDAQLDVEVNSLKGSTRTKVTTKIGRRTAGETFNGKIEDVTLYSRALKKDEVQRLGDMNAAAGILATAPDKRTKAQSDLLTHLWSRDHDSVYRQMDDEKQAVTTKKEQLDGEISNVMVMAEMPKPRDCYVLIRGQYDHHGEAVTASLPKFLPPMPAGAPNNRLGLAEWIVSPTNPLTSRVVANRMWERLFGTGIVETIEDFGTRASFPSHPELLDWLGTEFVRLKWNQKALWKEMVTSATYRQSSKVTPELERLDPLNRLLARGPRFRLTAEVLRDQAMYFGGLLVEKVGGPSVRPYQPDGVWDELNVYGNLRNYKHDMGDSLHRRSLYTIWKRTAAPPNMTLFDMPSRETCRVRRARTDTPLQALDMLNDVTYVEASRALALRMIREGGSTPESRLRFAFQVVLARDPSAMEAQILVGGLARRLAHYRADKPAAAKLIKQGDLKNPANLDPTVLAAYTLTASTILNLDEAITKE